MQMNIFSWFKYAVDRLQTMVWGFRSEGTGQVNLNTSQVSKVWLITSWALRGEVETLSLVLVVFPSHTGRRLPCQA